VITKKIGLITPYQGFNYGDGAIQDTMISNLKELDPDVECFGITLYPLDTQTRHGIKSIPITGLIVKEYSESELLFARELLPPHKNLNDADELQEPDKTDTPETQHTSYIQRLIEPLRSIKNIPLIGNLIRQIVLKAREIRKITTEITELPKSYRFAKQMNLLVYSGGGQLDEAHGGAWGHPYAMFRWAMLSKLTKTPLALVSIGSAKIETRLTRWFITQVLKTTSFRSYRDKGTKSQLSFLTLTQNDQIVRDLALGINPEPYLAKERKSSTLSVGISPIYHNASDTKAYEQYVKTLSKFIQWLVDHNYNVVIFRTTSIERLVIRDIWRKLKLHYSTETLQKIKEVEAPNYQELLSKINHVDFVVASRLHSIILSHVIRKPTLAVSWDRKVEAHMHDIKQSTYMIDIKGINLTALVRVFNLLEKNSNSVKTELEQIINGFQTDIQKQYRYLLELITLK
jgi:polysaccharide pyruvyl transferase WcaK-like protein